MNRQDKITLLDEAIAKTKVGDNSWIVAEIDLIDGLKRCWYRIPRYLELKNTYSFRLLKEPSSYRIEFNKGKQDYHDAEFSNLEAKDLDEVNDLLADIGL